MADRRGYWREPDGSPVAYADALRAWADESHHVLHGVAQRYHGVITYKELAEQVQTRTGIRTSALLHNWVGPMLSRVVHDNHRRGEPPLTALVVHVDDGMVGTGYAEVLEVAGEPALRDELERERHAAGARLECYRRYAVDLPADGGSPALAPRHQAAINRRLTRTEVAEPPKVCPRCFIQLPSTGECDSCGYSTAG
jgi:hypothetical protein